MKRWILVVVLAGWCCSAEWTNAEEPSPQVSPSPTPISAPTRWGLISFNRFSSSLHSPSDYRYRAKLSSTGMVTYRVSPAVRLMGVAGVSQELTQFKRFRLSNFELRGFVRPWVGVKKGDSTLLTVDAGLNITFPTQYESRTQESLVLGLGPILRTTFNLTGFGVPISGFYDLSLNRSFHEYQTSTLGEVNTSTSLDHYLLTSISVNSWLSFMLTAGFSSAWTYGGEVSNLYSFEQEVDFQVLPAVMLGLGHSIGGDVLAPSGQSYRFRVFNSDQSRVYLSLNVIF